MTTSKSVEAKIKEVIESRGLQQKFICEKIKIQFGIKKQTS